MGSCCISLRASSPRQSGRRAGKGRRACNYVCRIWISALKKSMRDAVWRRWFGNDIITLASSQQSCQIFLNQCKCKQTLTNMCRGNNVITNIISTNQHFISTFLDADFQISEAWLQGLLPFPTLLPECPGELAHRLLLHYSSPSSCQVQISGLSVVHHKWGKLRTRWMTWSWANPSLKILSLLPWWCSIPWTHWGGMCTMKVAMETIS